MSSLLCTILLTWPEHPAWSSKCLKCKTLSTFCKIEKYYILQPINILNYFSNVILYFILNDFFMILCLKNHPFPRNVTQIYLSHKNVSFSFKSQNSMFISCVTDFISRLLLCHMHCPQP